MKIGYSQLFATILMMALTHTAVATTTTVKLSTSDSHWQSLEYSKIPANQLNQTENGIQILVDGSASPLIYVFDQVTPISSILVKGTTQQLPVIPTGKKQGEKGADDFAFRIGLVIAGDKQLGFAQKLIAADWVKTLYGLAPNGTGISHIKFLNLANTPGPEWLKRSHPGSKGLFEELVVGHLESDGDFELNYQLEQKTPIVAFWISSDGDDTGSKYQLEIQHLAYSLAESN